MSIVIFFLVLVTLIVVHEFGHFLAAKRAGIRVDEFGIGFPPRLVGKKIGETLYSINLLPFGGFVRIFGEQVTDDALRGPESARSLVGKSKGIQAFVLFAGVLFNIIFAWGLLSLGYMVGIPTSAHPDRAGELTDVHLTVTRIEEGSPAMQAGFKTGDTIRFLEAGTERIAVSAPEEVATFVRAHHTEPITAVLSREGEDIILTATPEEGFIAGEPSRRALGIVTELVGVERLSFFPALARAALTATDMLVGVAEGLWHLVGGLFTLTADLSSITGPVGIVGLVGDASALGLIYLLVFTALISLNLAVINLLPLPALDGGRLLFLLIEWLRGTPIKPRVANALNATGFALLLLLMLVVTYNAIARLL